MLVVIEASNGWPFALSALFLECDIGLRAAADGEARAVAVDAAAQVTEEVDIEGSDEWGDAKRFNNPISSHGYPSSD